MRQRGRKSTASLTIVSSANVERLARIPAPAELTREESREWNEITGSLPADWLNRETVPLLVQYVRLICRARRLAQLIQAQERSKKFDVDTYRDLIRSEGEISRNLTSLATKMRISQQSSYDKSRRKPAQQIPRPWELDGDDD